MLQYCQWSVHRSADGKYHFTVSLLTDWTNTTFNLYLFKNGTSIGRVFFLNSVAANQQRILNNSIYVSLAAGDYIEVVSDQAAFWPWNEPMSQFSGHLVG